MARWEKEKLVVDSTPSPITKKQLVHDLKAIGVQPGDILSVHSSMSKIGWVVGDQVTVIEALMEAVSERGTIVMQAHSTGNSDPRNWNFPPVPEKWWETIRREMPPFRPTITPLRNIGRVPELFRTMPGVLRSNHPQVSCTAWGKHAKRIVKVHDLTDSYGDKSPWGVLYRLGSKILLLGADHESNTALHYAESKIITPETPKQITGAAIIQGGERKWVSWEEVKYNSDDFKELGAAFEKSIGYEITKVGQADSRLLPMRELIDFAIDWILQNR
ncbi:MAG: AAC(3) family N-acetyltransferase [Candidatus Thorarchaeota archaeon SMTZ1-45]|nr:MAG: hypothetical protein AM325_09815 [Candidatus Thorarchaeota archaeon SMTZ1-45]